MKDILLNEIINFLVKQACLTNITLKRETKIEVDLGITGEDAIELLVAYSKRFSVDISNFMAAEYFEAEGMNWLMPTNVINKKKLTIGDLEKGALMGKLDEGVIMMK